MSEGGDLRSQLETALARVTELEGQVEEFTVATVASKSEFSLVSAADLQGVPTEELEKKATAIQEERIGQQKILLAKAGLDEEAIEKVIAGEAVETGSNLDPNLQALAGLQSGGSSKRPPTVDEDQYFGRDAIKAHFRQEADAAAK